MRVDEEEKLESSRDQNKGTNMGRREKGLLSDPGSKLLLLSRDGGEGEKEKCEEKRNEGKRSAKKKSEDSTHPLSRYL